MNHIARDTHEVVYGLKDTMELVEQNIVKELILYEDLDAFRCKFVRKDNKEEITKYLS